MLKPRKPREVPLLNLAELPGYESSDLEEEEDTEQDQGRLYIDNYYQKHNF